MWKVAQAFRRENVSATIIAHSSTKLKIFIIPISHKVDVFFMSSGDRSETTREIEVTMYSASCKASFACS
jgi:hypothetical protein